MLDDAEADGITPEDEPVATADEEATADEGVSPTAGEESDDAVAVALEWPTLLPPTGGREIGWPAAEHSWTTALETAVFLLVLDHLE